MTEEFIITTLASQGVPVILLAVAVRYFYLRQKDWEAKIEVLYKERSNERTELVKLTEALSHTLTQNAEALEGIREILLTERETAKVRKKSPITLVSHAK